MGGFVFDSEVLLEIVWYQGLGAGAGWVVLFFRKKQLAVLRQFFLQKSTTHPTPIEALRTFVLPACRDRNNSTERDKEYRDNGG